MAECISLERGRKVVIKRLQSIFSDSELNFEKIKNTRLWDLEEKIGVDHFSFDDSIGRRSGYIPLGNISKDEIKSLIEL